MAAVVSASTSEVGEVGYAAAARRALYPTPIHLPPPRATHNQENLENRAVSSVSSVLFLVEAPGVYIYLFLTSHFSSSRVRQTPITIARSTRRRPSFGQTRTNTEKSADRSSKRARPRRSRWREMHGLGCRLRAPFCQVLLLSLGRRGGAANILPIQGMRCCLRRYLYFAQRPIFIRNAWCRTVVLVAASMVCLSVCLSRLSV